MMADIFDGSRQIKIELRDAVQRLTMATKLFEDPLGAQARRGIPVSIRHPCNHLYRPFLVRIIQICPAVNGDRIPPRPIIPADICIRPFGATPGSETLRHYTGQDLSPRAHGIELF